MNQIITRSLLHYVLIAVLIAGTLFFFMRTVPANMDEVSQYNVISALAYPLSVYNVFQENARAYDLAPFGKKFLPLRSYAYVGSFPCVLYYPFFKLWPHLASARLIGLLFLLIQAWCLRRLFKVDLLWAFIGLLVYMPYAFQHLVDTGVIGFQMTSVFLFTVLIDRWFDDPGGQRRAEWLYPAGIGFLIFLAIWTKLAYFYLLPGLLLVTASLLIRHKAALQAKVVAAPRRCYGQLALLFGIAIIPSIILLTARMRNGFMYFVVGSAVNDPVFEFATSNMMFLRLSEYFTNPLMTAHRVYHIDPAWTVKGMGSLFLIASTIIAGCVYHRRASMRGSLFVPFVGAFIITLGFVTKQSISWAMHHVILALPFLIIGCADILKRLSGMKITRIAMGLFVVINLGLYSDLAHLTSWRESDHPSKLALNDIINEHFASTHVLVNIDWGFYFIKALYGPKDQCVLYVNPFQTTPQAAIIKRIATETHRKLLFVGRTDSNSDLRLMRWLAPTVVEYETSLDTGTWRIWYEP